jgi:hypothetical protein
MNQNPSDVSGEAELHGGAGRTGEDGGGRPTHIDLGPFLRQEGRRSPRNDLCPQGQLRSQSQGISRPFGARQGFPVVGMTRLQSGMVRRVQRGHLRRVPEITLWVSRLLQRIRPE